MYAIFRIDQRAEFDEQFGTRLELHEELVGVTAVERLCPDIVREDYLRKHKSEGPAVAFWLNDTSTDIQANLPLSRAGVGAIENYHVVAIEIALFDADPDILAEVMVGTLGREIVG